MTDQEFDRIREMVSDLATSISHIPPKFVQDKVMILEAEQHLRVACLYLDNTSYPN